MHAITGRVNDHQQATRTAGQGYRETSGHIYGWKEVHISSTGPYWDPSDPSVGINSLRRWTPTLEINMNEKNVKDQQTTRQADVHTYILYCHSGYLTLWPAIVCDERNYGLRE